VVTVVAITAQQMLADKGNQSHTDLIDLFAKSLVVVYNANAPDLSECLLVVSPEHFATLKNGGVKNR
jgi:hypothetical protein